MADLTRCCTPTDGLGHRVRYPPAAHHGGKALLLEQAHREDWMLFFEHDAANACCRLESTEKGFEPPASLPALKKLGADPVQRAINPLLMRLTSAGPS